MILNSPLTRWLSVIGGALMTVFAVWFAGKKSGRDAEKAASLQQENERTEAVLDEVRKQQEIIQRNGRLTRDDTLDSLSKHKF